MIIDDIGNPEEFFNKKQQELETQTKLKKIFERNNSYKQYLLCAKAIIKYELLSVDALSILAVSMNNELNEYLQSGKTYTDIEIDKMVEDIVNTRIEILETCMNDDARLYYEELQINPNQNRALKCKLDMADKYKAIVNRLLYVSDDSDEYLSGFIVWNKVDRDIDNLLRHKKRLPLYYLISMMIGGIMGIIIMLIEVLPML